MSEDGAAILFHPMYPAPETKTGKWLPASDQFALAATLRHVFNALDIALSDTQRAAIGTAMHEDWTKRFETCTEFMTAF